MKERIKYLEKEITKQKESYYNGIQKISDVDYDLLEEELKILKPNSKLLNKVETTNGKIEHKIPMLSQKKEKNIEGIVPLLKHDILVGSFKQDGFSLKSSYNDGKFYQASTRGNGKFGQDITESITFMNFNKDVRFDILEIRGEVVCTKENFILLQEEMKKRGLEEVKSQRNCASGIAQRKSQKDLTSFLTFVAFDIIFDNNSKIDYNTKLNYLSSIGFNIPDNRIIKSELDIENFIEYYKEHQEDASILTDGLVFRINTQKIYEDLGIVGKYPNGSKCFKFASEEGITKINNIIYDVGMSGKISFIGEIEPIYLSGGLLTRCTLDNAKNIINMRLGIGSDIILKRANEIIPKITKVITEKEYKLPTQCPFCHTELIWSDTNIDLYCKNPLCEGIFLKKVNHFVKTLEIDGLSDKTILKLYNKGYLESVADIFSISSNAFMNLDGFKRTSSDKLYLAIQDKKNIPLNKFLTSLSIPKLGSNVGELLADNFKTLEKIEYITKGELLAIDGIGETITNNIIENVSFIELIADLLINNGCTIIDKNTNQDDLKESEIKNLNICITGSMEIIERKNAKQIIKDFGGYMKSSVSAKTDLLVCNEVSTSGKYKKASELGVKIITEKEFLKMIGM